MVVVGGQWTSLGRRQQSALFVLQPHKLGKTKLKEDDAFRSTKRPQLDMEETAGGAATTSLEAQRCQSVRRNKVGRLYVNEGF